MRVSTTHSTGNNNSPAATNNIKAGIINHIIAKDVYYIIRVE
ncbi:MAG TPA: hypothetical protein VHB48_05155 [Chitinophagaceae bacterium]|nr:hypothetical protein [Chitinophagaceae bacterium]